jgi:hypothetical protein
MNERANEDGQLEDVDDYDHQCEVVLKTLYWLAVLKVKDPEFDTSISLMSVRICSVKNSCSNMSPQSRSQSQSQRQSQTEEPEDRSELAELQKKYDYMVKANQRNQRRIKHLLYLCLDEMGDRIDLTQECIRIWTTCDSRPD